MEPVGGLQVLQFARQQDPDVTAIILTAYSSVESAVKALRLGAFDYLFKPAHPADIRRRVQEALQFRRQTLQQRRLLNQIESLRQTLDSLSAEQQQIAPPSVAQRFIRSGQLVIDTHHRTATLNNNLLNLTTAEFEVLLCLVKAAPQPVSPRQLVQCALGYTVDKVEARDVIKWHIHHLRRKIEPERRPRYIKTVRYKGYLWSNEQDGLSRSDVA